MRVLVNGSSGQLAGDIIDVLCERGHEVLSYDLDLDITDYDAVMSRVPELAPELLINAAAYTDVDGSESNVDTAYRVNFTGAQNLALACQRAGCPMVFFSTDYVFDGTKGSPYNEFDETRPLGVYGATKLQGERCVQNLLDRYFIFRLQWLFGAYGKRNFVRSILGKALSEGALAVVTDELGSPSWCRDVAEAVVRVATSGRFGTYHVANQGVCSRYDFAREILEAAGKGDVPIKPITRADLTLPASRPYDSTLDCFNMRLQGFPDMPHYGAGLRRYVRQLLESGL
ncbi:MAG: dTDP-4-dehydrorhamnose reductase [Candidatus Geothermincolia bacterium]